MFNPRFSHYLILSHNGAKYDSVFLMEYLLGEGIVPHVMYSGAKIMSFRVPKLHITVGDSYLHIQIALSQFPKSFGLSHLEEKGTFPHLMNEERYQQYVGPMPPLHMFTPDRLSPERRDHLIKWYNQKVDSGFVFDFQREIHSYCRMDTLLLSDGVMRYRDLLYGISKIDPWKKVTISSYSMTVFRQNYLIEQWELTVKSDDPAQPDYMILADKKAGTFYHADTFCERPIKKSSIVSSKFVSSDYPWLPNGCVYSSSKHSKESMEWLFYLSEDWNVPIQHAYSAQGEKRIRVGSSNYAVDGFCPALKIVLEFYG